MPRVPADRVATMPVLEWDTGRIRRLQDDLVVEEPLEIRVKGRPVSVTMRTPGDDEELALGFLLTEGLIRGREDVQAFDTPDTPDTDASDASEESAPDAEGSGMGWSAAGTSGADTRDADTHGVRTSLADTSGTSRPGLGAITSDADGTPRRQRPGNVIDVALRAGIVVDFERLARNVYAASSCGICGKASIDAIRVRGLVPPDRDVRLDPDVLRRLPETLRAAQTVFGVTGGLHAAGLFDPDGRLLALREDVGRHNAVDKIIGHALLAGGLPLQRSVLVVSGRGGFEIIQKSLAARIPIVAAVSAPSSLAVQLARELGQTLIGFLRGPRFVVYAGEERLGYR